MLFFLAGLIILLLPDHGEPVFVLNKMHGPSLMDLVGILLMFPGWLISCTFIISKWKQIKKWIGAGTVYMLLIFYLVPILTIVFALGFSVEWLLWTCVVIASLINLLFIVVALKIKTQA